MYVQVGDFCVSRGLTTVPLTRISCNTVFSKSQNARKAGTLCTSKTGSYLSRSWLFDTIITASVFSRGLQQIVNALSLVQNFHLSIAVVPVSMYYKCLAKILLIQSSVLYLCICLYSRRNTFSRFTSLILKYHAVTVASRKDKNVCTVKNLYNVSRNNKKIQFY